MKDQHISTHFIWSKMHSHLGPAGKTNPKNTSRPLRPARLRCTPNRPFLPRTWKVHIWSIDISKKRKDNQIDHQQRLKIDFIVKNARRNTLNSLELKNLEASNVSTTKKKLPLHQRQNAFKLLLVGSKLPTSTLVQTSTL